jgi:hypothetical protein
LRLKLAEFVPLHAARRRHLRILAGSSAHRLPVYRLRALKNRDDLVQKGQKARHRLPERKRGSLSEGLNESRSCFALARRMRLAGTSVVAASMDFEIAAGISPVSRRGHGHGPTASLRHANSRRGHGHPAVDSLLPSSPEAGCGASARPTPRRMDSKILTRAEHSAAFHRHDSFGLQAAMEPRKAKCASSRLLASFPSSLRSLSRARKKLSSHPPHTPPRWRSPQLAGARAALFHTPSLSSCRKSQHCRPLSLGTDRVRLPQECLAPTNKAAASFQHNLARMRYQGSGKEHRLCFVFASEFLASTRRFHSSRTLTISFSC